MIEKIAAPEIRETKRWAGRYSGRLILSLLLSLSLLASGQAAKHSPSPRPSSWAVPIKIEGLPNLHKVSHTLYRGAQPEEAGIPELKKLGIKTIINLRNFHSDLDEIGDVKIGYETIPINTWNMKEEYVVQFLRIVTDEDKTPVFLHCLHGADRTGTMTAVYRMAVEGWTKEEAMREMTEGGFGYHAVWKNIPEFIESLDIEAIKKKAGLAEKVDTATLHEGK